MEHASVTRIARGANNFGRHCTLLKITQTASYQGAPVYRAVSRVRGEAESNSIYRICHISPWWSPKAITLSNMNVKQAANANDSFKRNLNPASSQRCIRKTTCRSVIDIMVLNGIPMDKWEVVATPLHSRDIGCRWLVAGGHCVSRQPFVPVLPFTSTFSDGPPHLAGHSHQLSKPEL